MASTGGASAGLANEKRLPVGAGFVGVVETDSEALGFPSEVPTAVEESFFAGGNEKPEKAGLGVKLAAVEAALLNRSDPTVLGSKAGRDWPNKLGLEGAG